MEKVTVTFTQTRVVQDGTEGTKNETKFEKGRSYELDPRSAARWIHRGVAVPGKVKIEDQQPAEAKASPDAGAATMKRPKAQA